MTINQVPKHFYGRTRLTKILGVVDRAALSVLYVLVIAGLPMTAVGFMTQMV